jgi:hypothetical protein
MSRRARIGIVAAGLLVALAVVYFVNNAREKREQAARDQQYEVRLQELQRAFPPRAKRDEVISYLKSRQIRYLDNVTYGGNIRSVLIPIGEDPGEGIFCNYWKVYVAIDFDTSGALQEAHIQKLGHCL